MHQKLRILIVDDDRHMTRTIADILSLSGHEAVTACSGPEALEKAKTESLDCVLTDIKMPVMNGVELHRQLHSAYPGLPVLMMTAYAAEELIRQGLDEGVVGVFDKPLEIDHLLDFFMALAKNRIVAIVDDDPVFCGTLAEILKRRGFSVAQFTDPHTDVELIASKAQIILLDMNLNAINGLDVLKMIRQRFTTLPVLLVTGYCQEMSVAIQDALEINACACLYKPLEIPALLKTLAQTQLTRLRKVVKSQ
jgi:two-component system response regulator HydG